MYGSSHYLVLEGDSPLLSVTSCRRREGEGDCLDGLGDIRLTGDPDALSLGVTTLDGDRDLDLRSEAGRVPGFVLTEAGEAAGLVLMGDGEADRWGTGLTGE